MSSKLNKKLKTKRKSQYVNKNMTDFRNELLSHATNNFSDQISDFSETSLGGMLLDFAAIVGDSISFYIEQQVKELNYETSTNSENIVKHLKNAGIKSNNRSPSSVNVTFFIEVNAEEENGKKVPKKEVLPIVRKNTIVSERSVEFTLIEDVDFSHGYDIEPGDEDDDGNIISYILSKKGLCISGNTITENHTFSADNNNNFLFYELENENVTDIISIIDSDLNEYYEVDYLSQSTIYKKVEFSNNTYFEILPAIYRFVRETNFSNGKTMLRFGNGDGKVLKDNILDNPEDILLPIRQSDYFQSKSLDPNMLIKSNSLGVSPQGSTISIRYRYGGGLDHNVQEGTIDNVIKQFMTFPNVDNIDTFVEEINDIRLSLDVINEENAVGGSNGLKIEELKTLIPNAMKTQSRIITHEDLIGRIYSMPTNFGKINKVAAIDNPYSNGSKDLYVICKDINNFYVPASDAIKLNLSKYLNEFRLIGDNFNILDVPVYNFGIKVEIRVGEGNDIDSVIDDVLFRIIEDMRFDSLQIGEALNTNDLVKLVLGVDGVVSIITRQQNMIVSKNSANEFFDEDEDITLTYNNNFFNPISDYDEGFIYPEPGGIFEMRYTANDIEIIAN
jgi:hypothetical protein